MTTLPPTSRDQKSSIWFLLYYPCYCYHLRKDLLQDGSRNVHLELS